MGQNESHVAIFFIMQLNIPFQATSSVPNWWKLKSVSCLCPKLLNFEIGETANLKIQYNQKTKLC